MPRVIGEAIDRIERYTEDLDEAGFLKDERTQDAVIRNLEVIGEASRNIEREQPGFASRYPELPLSFAYEMRNVLAHGYFKVDLSIVWKTVAHDLPLPKEQVRVIIQHGSSPADSNASSP